MSKEETSPPVSAPAKKRRGLHRFGLWSAGVVLVLSLVAGLGLWGIMGRAIAAPDWVSLRLQERLNVSMAQSQMRIAFSDLEFTLHQGWRPKARLRDVRINNLQGAQIFRFSQADVHVLFAPLLQRQIKLKKVDISGVFATLQRDQEGLVTLRGGAGLGGAAQQAANLPALIGRLDQAFDLTLLSLLQRADVRALTLRYEDALSQRIWVVDGGRLHLERENRDLRLSADMAVLGGGADVATLAANYTSRIGETEAQFGITVNDFPAQDIATQNPALAWLSVLRAPISGALRSGVQEDGTLDKLHATLQIGTGVVQPTEAAKPVPFSSASTYLTFDPRAQLIDFTDISIDSKWLTARVEGQAHMGRLDNGLLKDLVGQFQLVGVKMNPVELYETPVAFDAADMDFKLTLDPFELKIGRMQIMDETVIIRADGAFSVDEEGWRYAANSHVARLDPERMLALWPESLISPTRDWLAKNVLEGGLSNIILALRGEANHPVNSFLSFDFEKGKVRLLETMPPLTRASGNASLLANRFVVNVEKGEIIAPRGGAVDVGGSSFTIPDVTVKNGVQGQARLQTESTITAALSLLNQPKLEVMDKAGFPVNLAKGRARLKGSLTLPLRRGIVAEDVKYNAKGILSDVKTDAIVPDKTISAKSLRLTASQNNIQLQGAGRIGAVSFDARWSQPLGKRAGEGSEIQGQIELSQNLIDEFNLGLPDGTAFGKGQGNIRLVLAPKADPVFSLSSNLKGLGLRVSALGWRKGTGAAGTLKVSGRLGKSPQVDELFIETAGLKARGRITTRKDGSFERASFSRVTVGRWLRAPVVLTGRGAGAAPLIEVQGGILDLRNAEFGQDSGGGGSSGGPLRLRLDRLQVTDTLALTNMQGNFTTHRGLDGSFDARLNGGAKLQGRVLPQNGRSAVRIVSKNAGGIFASAEVLKQARGGDLTLTLRPVGKGGAFDGSMRVLNTRIKDAPAIADLLSALSIIGLLEQMSGDGILFSEVEADFRLTPTTMTLLRASAIGPSMGISMDGVYDVVRGTLNMQGVISPIYLLNGIGSILTRKGEGLIGFNYRLRGKASDPRVSVNPLSALTPGMFREIFRRPAPKVPRLESERSKPSAQEAARAAQRKRDLAPVDASNR